MLRLFLFISIVSFMLAMVIVATVVDSTGCPPSSSAVKIVYKKIPYTIIKKVPIIKEVIKEVKVPVYIQHHDHHHGHHGHHGDGKHHHHHTIVAKKIKFHNNGHNGHQHHHHDDDDIKSYDSFGHF
ncbi:hypothetical protein DERF_011739 [Dermatophagoides farinae]|uniref:Uncharacterized protein n=1 Tax=Dermatophagoides farinae TaxID=6954 RepID=A0A922HW01_DERFA|nr:hypothetical protein DERF_011739 [Dermatophagoides farinae]